MNSAVLDNSANELRELLSSFPASLDKANGKGFTPTFIAAQNGNIEALKLLVDAKADLDKADNDG
eukprot:7151605-Heterocapsa_arctica.AAC.2